MAAIHMGGYAVAAFRAATDMVGNAAEHIVFLDDDHLNIEAATKYGMSTVLLDGAVNGSRVIARPNVA